MHTQAHCLFIDGPYTLQNVEKPKEQVAARSSAEKLLGDVPRILAARLQHASSEQLPGGSVRDTLAVQKTREREPETT